MNEGPIEIIFAGDRKMVKGVFLCLLTVAHYTKKAVNVHFLTMTVRTKKFKGDAVTEEDLAFLKNYFGHGEYPMTFETVDVGPLYRKTLGGTTNENTGFTPYTLLRLFAPDLLTMDHALYLDADIMTSSSLESLWDIDISNYELAGVIDHIGKYWMPKGYFNAGVMDLNLKAIRESRLFEKSIVYVAHHFLFMPDQTAVNRLVKKKLLIEAKYNEQERGYKDGTVIKHFSQVIKWFPFPRFAKAKPWDVEAVHKTYKTNVFDPYFAVYFRDFPFEQFGMKKPSQELISSLVLPDKEPA
jgi:lipopolysaccharide biosynthesis glycosyltransferase